MPKLLALHLKLLQRRVQICRSLTIQPLGAKPIPPHAGNWLYRVWRDNPPSLQTSQLLPRGPFLRIRERSPGLESVCPDSRELSNPLPVLLSLAPHCTKPALRLQGSPAHPASPRGFPGSQHSRTSIQFTVLHYVSPEFLRAASISSQRAHRLPPPYYRHPLLTTTIRPSTPPSVPTEGLKRRTLRLSPG